MYLYKERTTKEYLHRLIKSLTEDFVIVTRYGDKNYHIPSILKYGNKYQIYLSIFSQFEDYSIDELIDCFLKFVNSNDEYYFDIITKKEFEELRKLAITNDVIEKSSSPKDENFNIIVKELEKYGGTYVLFPHSNKVEFLIAACSTDEDYYYVCLTLNGIEVNLCFQSCVGGFISLIDKFNEKDYKSIQNYILNEHIETLDPKTLKPGHEVITEHIRKEFDESTENVLFTPIYLIRD